MKTHPETLRVNQVTLRYGNMAVLRDISLSVHAGEVLGLIGPNGAGKSSLLRVLAGLQPPNEGTAQMEGVNLAEKVALWRARRIAFLPQEAETLPPMAVRELVSLGRIPFGNGRSDEDRLAVEEALQQTRTLEFAHRTVTSLSGGERARVLLSRALAVRAPVVLADEPIAALDPAHALSVMNLFRDLSRKGMAVVVVLHDLVLASRFCDRVALLKDGKLVSMGLPTDVLTDSMVSDVYGVTVQRVCNAVIPWDLV
ncbi:ABC transporter ATP-binding protein [Acetobacter sp.]|jgi:iron complex transport system ATP-binding protein|uniref:ABC transporter ATP-binding protein n=1 Tax=Acetobacter sp. TaxID=440 RepID=UPI0025B8D511|nr:ABC transporter ATP-binding protein [Acetobacter sp.]MCH4090640.1 ABC transporter ATP-binding protein [Acetobacter sp.]MCI1300083.1 ABC transporter ATP-binding protein [Acetobacter sp.]MCI1316501.1 ABC transporter ATP-binding protein [Acetobacter sp.]